jgi:hypothetical protein
MSAYDVSQLLIFILSLVPFPDITIQDIFLVPASLINRSMIAVLEVRSQTIDDYPQIAFSKFIFDAYQSCIFIQNPVPIHGNCSVIMFSIYSAIAILLLSNCSLQIRLESVLAFRPHLQSKVFVDIKIENILLLVALPRYPVIHIFGDFFRFL